jgi:hypothetical protein
MHENTIACGKKNGAMSCLADFPLLTGLHNIVKISKDYYREIRGIFWLFSA